MAPEIDLDRDLAFELRSAALADAALAAFDRAQAECYGRFGVAAAVVTPERHESIAYLWARHGGEPVAGLRIHRRRPDRPLPLERFHAGDPALLAAIDARAADGIAELAGLWSAPGWSGTGIGARIVAAAIERAAALGVRHLCSFAHQGNRFARRLGFRRDPLLRPLPYPDDRYRSTVLWCDATRRHGESRWNSPNGLAASASTSVPIARIASSME